MSILMIEPIAFGFNTQTAENNFFQQNDNLAETKIQAKALQEFSMMVKKLREQKIDVITIQDTVNPHTPDSIFPNNWVSFHENGTVLLYPMFAENRRLERREDILNHLQSIGFQIYTIIDFSHYEQKNIFLEGTGSMILDRKNRIAYAALSQRTDKNLFLKFCKKMNFQSIAFSAFQSVGNKRLPIYHTNVIMCISDTYTVVCMDTIDKQEEREMLRYTLENSQKTLVEISEKQMNCFAGNMLQVKNIDGKKFLVMSQSAYNSLNDRQLITLQSFNEIISVEIPTIEKYGGGSARCMMAEVFLPKHK
jgi:hypothetical protein